jgi:hypothetical protein
MFFTRKWRGHRAGSEHDSGMTEASIALKPPPPPHQLCRSLRAHH